VKGLDELLKVDGNQSSDADDEAETYFESTPFENSSDEEYHDQPANAEKSNHHYSLSNSDF